MPFENHSNRAFTAISIDNNAPAESCVYGLSNARRWIYIGESDNLRLRLLDHLRETDTFLNAQMTTGFTYELCTPADRIVRQDRLVLELEPVVNQRETR
jgi:hypothetical protein